MQGFESCGDFGVFVFSGFGFEFVGVEADVYPFAGEGHIEVVVANLFVHRIVAFVLVLVGLDDKQCVPDEFPMVDSAAHCAVALAGVELPVVSESVEVLVDVVAHGDFLCL